MKGSILETEVPIPKVLKQKHKSKNLKGNEAKHEEIHRSKNIEDTEDIRET